MVKVYKADDVLTVFDNSSVKNSDQAGVQTVNFILEKARKEAEIILAEARREAEDILAAARDEAGAFLDKADETARKLYDDARAGGYSQGLADCRDNVEKMLKSADLKATSIIENANNERAGILNGLKGEILTLSLNITEKILSTELDRNDEAFISLVSNAVDKVADENIKVKVSFDDYDKYFKDQMGEEFAKSKGLNITFIKDRLLKNGDCIVDSESGSINAGVDSQLKQVRLAFGVDA